jgi:hypothetical protein
MIDSADVLQLLAGVSDQLFFLSLRLDPIFTVWNGRIPCLNPG